MKSYIEYITESSEINALSAKELDNKISGELDIDTVKSILKHPKLDHTHLSMLVSKIHELPTNSLGHVVVYSMAQPNKHIRNQLAYQLLSTGKMNDEHLKAIARHALKVPDVGFDDHLAKKLIDHAIDKVSVTKRINELK